MAQKVMYPGMVNSPETTITNGISESDTIIYVLDPTRVPEPPNLMTLGTGTNAETIKVTEINDSAITVERGFQGVAKSWPAGTVIARNFTEYDYQAIKDNIEDLDASKETPAGAQAKADAAETNANNYTDQEVTKITNNLASHKNDNTPHREAVSIERKNPDDDGIFKLIEFRRSDGTLFKTSQLNGTSPYNSRTVKYYDKNENLMQTVEYSITYSNDEVISEVIISA